MNRLFRLISHAVAKKVENCVKNILVEHIKQNKPLMVADLEHLNVTSKLYLTTEDYSNCAKQRGTGIGGVCAYYNELTELSRMSELSKP